MSKIGGFGYQVAVGVTISVVSTLAAAILALVPGAWQWFVAALGWLWGWASYRVPLPVWALVLIVCALIPTVIKLWGMLFKTRELTSRDYTEDTFEGLVWRWRYTGNQVSHLLMFCPRDDTQLVYIDNEFSPHVDFICVNCGNKKIAELNGNIGQIKATVLLKIDHKIRSGGWKAVVESKRAVKTK